MSPDPTFLSRLTRWMGWNRTSGVLIGGFFLLLFLIGYIWWPLAADYLATYNPAYPWWLQVDWLLIAIFLGMSLLITSHPSPRHDLPILMVGLIGGTVIETWGTQSGLWAYFTGERPPVWILPAWPIASLAIDRIDRILQAWTKGWPDLWFSRVYPIIFAGFGLLMVHFVHPTLTSPLTWAALALCGLLIITPNGQRSALLTFAAGSLLGYFLEVWGTTRACWVYYTHQTPPFFAVLAHGMAAIAFGRSQRALEWSARQLLSRFNPARLAGWRSRAD
jgi:MFS family permease